MKPMSYRDARSASKLRFGAFVSFSAVSVLALGVLTAVLYGSFRSRLYEDIRKRLRDVASLGALQIDVRAHNSLTDPADEGNATYLRVRGEMQAIRDAATDIRFVYTMRKGPNGEIVFVVDAETNPENIAHLGEVYDDPGQTLSREFSSLVHPVVENEFYSDKFGTWLSGYAPFYGDDGQRAGVIGIDIAGGSILTQERRFLLSALAVFGAAVPFLLLAAWWLSRRLSEIAMAAQDTLVRHAEFDRLISRISSDLVGLSPGAIDAGIDRALASIGAFTEADRAYVSQYKDGDVARMHTLHEWDAEGIKPQAESLKNISLGEGLPWLAERILKREVFHVPDVATLPSEARLEREYFEAQDIRSLIVVPMTSGRLELSFLGLDTEHTCRVWTADDQSLLQLVGETIAHTLNRKRAEEERERIFGMRDYMICTASLDEYLVTVNAAFEQVLGYSSDELLSRPYTDLVHPDDVERTHAVVKEQLSRGKNVVAFENRYRCKDGSYKWLSWTSQPVPEEDITYAIAYDITERKRAEEERISFERQVQHAQKLESLGVLAGGIAHDFNNILMAVLGYADLALADLAETHPALSSVREIEKGAKRAAELTRQMLAYSGKGRFVIEAMDVSALMDDMAHLLRTSIPRTVALNLHLDHSLPAIEADASQVQQVVMNLITNAADAIGDEDGAIALATGAMDCTTDYLARNLAPPLSPEDAVQPGAYVFFEVSDTGCGMDEEARAKLFEPFFTTKFTGRGLGMAAVQGIVRGHKGAIVLDTEPGKGSTFRVLLPVAEGEQTDGAEEKTKAPETADWSAQGTILVVDDEAQIRNLMQLVLKRKGFTVLTADDGRHAVEVFQEHKDEIICVLLDLTMPHMGGEETYAELHRICENVQVILVSGYSEQELEQRVEDLGFAGFLTKPVGSKMLLDKVRLVLNLTEGV